MAILTTTTTTTTTTRIRNNKNNKNKLKSKPLELFELAGKKNVNKWPFKRPQKLSFETEQS
jgi:hypothetical protein